MSKFQYHGSALLFTLVLVGCAPITPREPIQRLDYVAPQTCSCQIQCDALWAVGIQKLSTFTGMRIRIATDSMAETYVSNNAGRMTGIINKMPIGDGKYEIKPYFSPWASTSDLETLAYNSQTLFNMSLGRAKETTPCPTE